MPFDIELKTVQETKLWTFKQNEDTKKVQALIDTGKRDEFVKAIAELSHAVDEKGKPRHFITSAGNFYELVDEADEKTSKIKVPIRFQVKGPVITWSFNSPLNKTHQEFRDLVFNTAAAAHAHVENACETYYRGTDHLHLRIMHVYEGEAYFNHNHYRTANNGLITPKEVFEHILAFHAQKHGQKFITTVEERDSIILKYALYWADENLDINYVIFTLLVDGVFGKTGGIEKLVSQLKEIARLGRLTPAEADKQLDQFFSSAHGKNMLNLALAQVDCPIKKEDLETLIDSIKKDYRVIYKDFAPNEELMLGVLGSEMEPQERKTPESKFSSSKRSSTPQEEYSSESNQILDEIDRAEFQTFASLLTKHCRNIKKELYEHLEFEDFRKGLLLYFALQKEQEDLLLKPKSDKRFHPDFKLDETIRKMINELPSLLEGTTEGEMGPFLLSKLVDWVQNAPPGLEKWVGWVKVNGSRGLGAEISGVRSYGGEINVKKAIPMSDRKAGTVAEIDFNKFDLTKIFRVHKEDKRLDAKHAELTQSLKQQLIQLVQLKQLGGGGISDNEFRDKQIVINAALAVLAGKEPLSKLIDEIHGKNPLWATTSLPGAQSSLLRDVRVILTLFESKDFEETIKLDPTKK